MKGNKNQGTISGYLNFEREIRLKNAGIFTDQEFLNFGIFSSFKESAIEDFEATAQPLHKVSSTDNMKHRKNQM